MNRKARINPLVRYFNANNKNLMHKWLHYFDIYHRYFEKFRGKEVVVLEFGVSHGGSLQMWKHYFGKKARIIGVDINPECKKFAESQIDVVIGSQEDPRFLGRLMKKIGGVDIIIDDGGHTMLQQNTTFDITYPYVNAGGIYLVEDLHTSYWSEFGGGYRKSDTFIERTKSLVDSLHAWHSRDNESLRVDEFTKSTRGIHFYDSVIVFEKDTVLEPVQEQRGRQGLRNLESWNYRSSKSTDS